MVPNRQRISSDTSTGTRFLTQFQTEQLLFQQCMHGIVDDKEREHYTIVLLNRLMFLYFIQSKGLLAGNTHYLSDQLQTVQECYGPNKFFTFYRCLLKRISGQQYTYDRLLDEIPILNTHLFTTPEYRDIEIEDKAFTRLFAFFDTYEWQIDGYIACQKATVTPDILGCIVEKYINQKQVGAYYTNEDITDYISKNTLIPHLFQSTRQHYFEAFAPGGPVWSLLQVEPERYISEAIRSQALLPEETEREYRARHIRCSELKELLIHGKVTSIHMLTTYNLDSCSFAKDVLTQCQDHRLLQVFYETLTQMTILDPTCGSGAFLFAALRMLRPLYEICIRRLDIEVPANQPLFILKTIIERNLYGVDIISEAVEACILRLFLHLAATFRNANDIEQCKDGYFNIRTGNTLIGITSASTIAQQEVTQEHCDQSMAQIYGINPSDVDAFQQWHTSHRPFHWCVEFSSVIANGGFDIIIGNPPYVEYSKIRQDYLVPGYEKKSCGNLYAAVIERALALCRSECSYLGLIVPLSICSSERFVALREAIQQNTKQLWLANFEIFPCRLFEGAFQRLSILLAQYGTTTAHTTYTTRIRRWYTAERPHLIDSITYTRIANCVKPHVFPKLASPVQECILRRIVCLADGCHIATVLQTHKTEYFVYYQEATNYWMKATCRIPYFKKDGIVKKPAHGRFLYFGTTGTAHVTMALMNSSLFYLWFAAYSDGFHLSHALVKEFPVDHTLYERSELLHLACKLEEDIKRHAQLSTRNTAVHQIELEEYRISYSKPVLDEIDRLLANHYGLSDDELDFIINYDIKYRMGKER